jgi:glycine betaine/proline transport system permease protein
MKNFLKNKKNLFNVAMLGFFVWLLFISYNSSKRKPDNVGELLKFDWLQSWPKWLDLPLMAWINDAFKKLNETYGWIFEAVNNFLLAMLVALKNFLILAPWPLVILGVVVIAYFASGRKIGTTLFVGFCTFFIGFLHPIFWQKAIETTAIMLISIFLCTIVGIPIGILMARSHRVRDKILPVLDLMQTIPAFVYLIPGIMLFGLGAVPAIIATFIYAVPPLVRLTDLGIRLVDKEVIEAADAFGASKKQKLLGVQLPLALPNIMQGINQCTMMALSMVVIASMIGTRGLGDEVLLGLQQLNVGKAAEAGIAIVLLAIVLDRITQSYGETLQERSTPQIKKKK